MSRTDWRKVVDKDWIGCYILPDSGVKDTCTNVKSKVNSTNPYAPIQVKLLKVEHKTVKVKGKDEAHVVAYFDKNPHFSRPMLLSAKTNLNRIEKMTGSRFIEDWGNINRDVILQAEWDKAYGGGYNWALRIAIPKPELKEGTVNWTGAIDFVKSGKDPEKIKSKYKISDDLMKKLKEVSVGK